MDEQQRFWAKVDKSGECWVWTAGCGSAGYGMFHPAHGESVLAHRYAYTMEVGPIPDGEVIDHECHNDTTCKGGKTCPHRKCVTPGHLKPKSNAENLADGPNHNSKKTHCPRDHEYTEANTYTTPSGQRRCRECAREQDRSPERVAAHRTYKQKARV